MTRTHDADTARPLLEDQAHLAAAAVALRRSAAGAGQRGQYTEFSPAGLPDSASLQLDQIPARVRRAALAAAGHLLDGPEGHREPRTIGVRVVAVKPGHRGR